MDWSTPKLIGLIGIGSGVGLMAAIGRELHRGKAVTRAWIVQRLLIMPFLALTASAIADNFRLSPQTVAFVASLLSLLSFEAVNIILLFAVRRAERTLDYAAGATDAGAAIEVPAGKGVPAHVTIDLPPTGDPRTEPLRKAFRAADVEPLPDDMTGLVKRLDEGEST